MGLLRIETTRHYRGHGWGVRLVNAETGAVLERVTAVDIAIRPTEPLRAYIQFNGEPTPQRWEVAALAIDGLARADTSSKE